MASLTIRRIDDSLIESLRVGVARHGRSMEEGARQCSASPAWVAWTFPTSRVRFHGRHPGGACGSGGYRGTDPYRARRNERCYAYRHLWL